MFDPVAVVEAVRAGRMGPGWEVVETRRRYLARRWGVFVIIGGALAAFSGIALSIVGAFPRAVGPIPTPRSAPELVQLLAYLATSGLWIPLLIAAIGIVMFLGLIPYDALPWRRERLMLMPDGFIVTRGGAWRVFISVAYEATAAITPESPRGGTNETDRYPLRIAYANGVSQRWDPRGRFGPASQTGARIISDFGRLRARQAGAEPAAVAANAPPVNAAAILARARGDMAEPGWAVWGRTGPRKPVASPYGRFGNGYAPPNGAPTPAWIWTAFIGVPIACIASGFVLITLCSLGSTVLGMFAHGGSFTGAPFWLLFGGGFLVMAGAGVWGLGRLPSMLEAARYWLAALTPDAFIISTSANPEPELVIPFATTSRIAYRQWSVSNGESSTTIRALDIWRADGSFLTWQGIPQKRLADLVIQAHQAYLAQQASLPLGAAVI